MPGYPREQHNPLPQTEKETQELFNIISAVLTQSENVSDWIEMFKSHGICRDAYAAERLAYDLDRVPRQAVRQAQRFVRGWLTHGDAALLFLSSFPCQNELALLHTKEHELAVQSDGRIDLPVVMAVLRADVVALARLLQSKELGCYYQTLCWPYSDLYDASLWHQPRYSPQRTRYQERMSADFRLFIVNALAGYRNCDRATAAHLVDVFITSTMNDLIAWRCHQHYPTIEIMLERGRIRRAMTSLVAALPHAHQQTMLSRFEHFQDALETAAISLPLYAMVTDLPGSVERRRQQQRKLPDQLFSDFARRIGVEEGAAWNYVNNTLIDDSMLTDQVNCYATLLGWPALPPHIVIAIRNHFPKQDFYNSGDGDAIAGVPRRKSLKLAGVARLHEQWLLVPYTLNIQLTDQHRRPIGETCHVIAVFDCGCQRLINCMVQPFPPTEADLGIALYLAIWQPNNLSWPLRGVPEHILIPSELALHTLHDIKAAASWLLAGVETVGNLEKLLNRHQFLRQSLKDVQKTFNPVRVSRRHRPQKEQMTIRRARERVMTWFYTYCSSNDHRVERVQKTLRDQGYALPGWDTPAAGWLLPEIATKVPTIRDGVVYAGSRYLDSDSAIEPGYHVPLRALVQDTQRPQRVFVVYGDPPLMRSLHLAGRV